MTLEQVLIKRYSNVGQEIDANGNTTKEGLNWLINIPKEHQFNLAKKYEVMAHKLVSQNIKTTPQVEIIAFVMIRMIFRLCTRELDIAILLDRLNSTYEKIPFEFNKPSEDFYIETILNYYDEENL